MKIYEDIIFCYIIHKYKCQVRRRAGRDFSTCLKFSANRLNCIVAMFLSLSSFHDPVFCAHVCLCVCYACYNIAAPTAPARPKLCIFHLCK